MTISVSRSLTNGISFKANYTWSHALDDVSNGGVQPFGVLGLITNASLLTPQNPNNLHSNYGNSDYDVRQYFSATFVMTDMFRHAGMKWGPNRVFGGWTLASNWFVRSGLPFTVVDNSASFALAPYNFNSSNPFEGAVLASSAGKLPGSCGGSAVNTPCLTTSQFASSVAVTGVPTGFGTIGRNSIFGPHFFDVDLALMKDVKLTEKVTFTFGAQAYNLFNHANFDQPQADISNPNFGMITNTVSPPTSILGSFLGAGGSPRFLEIRGLVRF